MFRCARSSVAFRSRVAQLFPGIISIICSPSSQPLGSMRKTLAPYCAKKRVATGPAMIRVRSRTFKPSNGRAGCGLCSSLPPAKCRQAINGSSDNAMPCGSIAHSSKFIIFAAVPPFSTIMVSSSSAFELATFSAIPARSKSPNIFVTTWR